MEEKKKQRNPIPAWLDAKVDQRLAAMKTVMGRDLKTPMALIMTPLSEPGPNASPLEYKYWERSCDNCGRYCSGEFSTGHVIRHEFGTQVMFVFGVCPSCKEAHPVEGNRV